jgi:hypothetical protein
MFTDNFVQRNLGKSLATLDFSYVFCNKYEESYTGENMHLLLGYECEIH